MTHSTAITEKHTKRAGYSRGRVRGKFLRNQRETTWSAACTTCRAEATGRTEAESLEALAALHSDDCRAFDDGDVAVDLQDGGDE